MVVAQQRCLKFSLRPSARGTHFRLAAATDRRSGGRAAIDAAVAGRGAVDDDGAKSAYGSCSAVSSTAAVDDADARRAAPTGCRRTELSLAK